MYLYSSISIFCNFLLSLHWTLIFQLRVTLQILIYIKYKSTTMNIIFKFIYWQLDKKTDTDNQKNTECQIQ